MELSSAVASKKVQRRFREFVALRRDLLHEFPEYPLPLPELPPKTLLASTDAALLQQRRVMLDEFLKALCSSRGLLSSANSQSFLGFPDFPGLPPRVHRFGA